MDGDDGCTTMRIYLMSLNCKLKMINMVIVILCIFYNTFLYEEFRTFLDRLKIKEFITTRLALQKTLKAAFQDEMKNSREQLKTI